VPASTTAAAGKRHRHHCRHRKRGRAATCAGGSGLCKPTDSR
jgi:hypothetical protein